MFIYPRICAAFPLYNREIFLCAHVSIKSIKEVQISQQLGQWEGEVPPHILVGILATWVFLCPTDSLACYATSPGALSIRGSSAPVPI